MTECGKRFSDMGTINPPLVCKMVKDHTGKHSVVLPDGRLCTWAENRCDSDAFRAAPSSVPANAQPTLNSSHSESSPAIALCAFCDAPASDYEAMRDHYASVHGLARSLLDEPPAPPLASLGRPTTLTDVKLSFALQLIGQIADGDESTNDPYGALQKISRTAWHALGQLRPEPSPVPEEEPGDLEWLVANDASFGTSSRLQDDGTWLDKRFCRVPCRHLYEWHCYDGETWRDALAAARASGPCIEDEEKVCTKGGFGPGDQHPVREKMDALEEIITALRAENARLRSSAAFLEARMLDGRT